MKEFHNFFLIGNKLNEQNNVVQHDSLAIFSFDHMMSLVTVYQMVAILS